MSVIEPNITIQTEDGSVTTKAYNVGDYLIRNNFLYKVLTNISAGGTITEGVNIQLISNQFSARIIMEIINSLPVIDNLTTNDTNKILSAKQGKVLKDTIDQINATLIKERLTTLEEYVADLMYIPISINSFSVSPNTAEIGSAVTTVTLSYNINKIPESATLDSTNLTIESTTDEIIKNNLSQTTTKTWTLSVTDERNSTATGTATLSFLNRVYYGAAAEGTIDSSFLLGLNNKILTSSKGRTIIINVDSNEYIWYAVPSRLGACSFKVGGFDGGFTKIQTISHTNASGYTENYDVYRSDNASLGSTTVTVS